MLVTDFNEALSNLKEKYPENPIIESTDPVDPTEEKLSWASVNWSGQKTSTYEGVREEALYEVRSNCERIANSLGYELPDDSPGQNTDQMVIVRMDNTQSSKQAVSQSVTFDQVVELIKHEPQAQTHQEELQDLAEKFNEELESEDCDEGVLRQYIKNAKQYSTSVAAKLSMLALQNGATGILGF